MNLTITQPVQRNLLSLAISMACSSALVSASTLADTTTPTVTSATSAGQRGQQTPSTLIEKPRTLATIMVTAQKREQPAIDVPGSVTSLDSSDLSRGSLSHLSDYASQIAGMSVSSAAPGFTQVVIRGITTGLTQAAPTTSFYIDDAPVGSLDAYGGGSVLTPDIDPADLERIEVLKGPQGTLYGAGAVGGLVRYVTRSPDFQKVHTSVTVGGDSVDHGGEGSKVRAYVNLPFDNHNMALQANVYDNREPGYIDDLNGRRDVNQSRAKGGRIAYTWLFNNNWKGSASALTQRINNSDNPTEDVNGKTLQPIYGKYIQNAYVPQPTERMLNLYNLTVHGTMGSFQLVSSTTYQGIYANQIADSTATFRTLLRPYINARDIGSRSLTSSAAVRWSQEFRVDSTALDNKLGYEAGFYFSKEHDANRAGGIEPYSTRTLQPISLPFNIFSGGLGATYKEYSAFANANYSFTSKFSIQAGARYSKDSSTYWQAYNGLLISGPVVVGKTPQSDHKATYLLTASYALAEDRVLYARVATGYRPGGPNVVVPASIYPAPHTFNPDSLTSYELGYKSVFDDGKASFEAALFTTHWKDIQIQTSGDGFSFLVNGGSATSKGAEATLVIYPAPAWDIRFTGSYTDARLTSDAPLAGGIKGDEQPFVPKTTGAISSHYHWPISGGWTASAGGSVNYTGSRVSDYNARYPTKVPDYTTLNIDLGIQHDPWRLSLYAKNITNSDGVLYLATRNAAPDLQPYAAALIQPRTIGLEANYSF